MVEFKKEEDVEKWLADKPRAFAEVLAARAALRVVPALAALAAGDKRQAHRRTIILPVLRAMALPRLAATYPSRSNDIRSAARSAYSARSAADSADFAADSAAYSARSAASAYSARSAASAARSAADSAAWLAISADATALENGVTPHVLTSRKLWPGKRPVWATKAWLRLRKALVRTGDSETDAEDWEVWTIWYEAVLNGGKPKFEGITWSDEIELARVLEVSEEEWKTGPKVVNAKIREIMERLGRVEKFNNPYDPDRNGVEPPAVPEQKPAAIEPVIRGGKIGLSKILAKSELKGQSLSAALKALRQQLQKIADEAEAAATEHPQIDKRHIATLRSLAEHVPSSRPRQDVLFTFGHELETLEYYQKIVAAEWPDYLAAQYVSMVRAYDNTLCQFAKWREFKRNPAKGELAIEDLQDIRNVAETTAAVLRDEQLSAGVDRQLPRALERLAEGLSNIEATPDRLQALEESKLELAADVLESINNIYKISADLLVKSWEKSKPVLREIGRAVRDTGKNFWTGTKTGANKAAKGFGYAAGGGAVSAIALFVVGALEKATGVQLLGHLIAKYPKTFGWAEIFLSLV